MRKQLSLLRKRRNRRGDGPSAVVARIGWLLIRLVHDGFAEYAEYRDLFGCPMRLFQRDLFKIRRIAGDYFRVDKIRKGRAVLISAPGLISALPSPRTPAEATLKKIAAALGGAIAHVDTDDFLHIDEPLPVADEAVTSAFAFLKDAAGVRARVEFTYFSRGSGTKRRVEPYLVVYRNNRYYLVAYDMQQQGWRYFALDAIGPDTLRRESTIQHPRDVPEQYLRERAVGWITGSSTTEVTFHVTPAIVTAVCGTKWQQDQRITRLPDGGAEITLAFNDLPEAVRWSLRFAPDATVLSPPQAVELARHTIDRLDATYREMRRTTVARAM